MTAAVTPEIPGPCLLLGHSLGGVVATAIAERRPDLVTHLAVVDSPRWWQAGSRPGTIWRTMSRRTVRNGLLSAFAPGFEFPEFFVDDFRLLRWQTFAGAMNSIDGFITEKSLYDRVAGIGAPTTVIFGEMEQRIDLASVAGYSSTGPTWSPSPRPGTRRRGKHPSRLPKHCGGAPALSGPL